mgnify:CR=1 FL=1
MAFFCLIKYDTKSTDQGVFSLIRQSPLMNAFANRGELSPSEQSGLTVLQQLENYPLPTNSHILVEEFFRHKIYSWYVLDEWDNKPSSDDPGWYLNYE